MSELHDKSTIRKLLFSSAIRRFLINQAEFEFPIECCGLLGGQQIDTKTLLATDVFPLVNELGSETAFRVTAGLIGPFREMRTKKLELVAIYHSHPRSPALPSKRDLEENFYREIPHLIISLAENKPIIAGFTLFSDRFESIELVELPADD